jgi:hypothetical protein
MFKWIKGDTEFWGPISMTLGIIALANTLLATSNIFLINAFIGVLLFVFGYSIAPKKALTFIRVAIPGGLTIFSSGIRVRSVAPALGWVGYGWWILVILGIAIIIVGFWRYFKIMKQSTNGK